MDSENKIIYPELSYKIVGCLFEVFNELGSNHRESYYQKAVSNEFERKKIKFVEQFPIDLHYKDEVIGKNFLDFYVENKVVLELKVGAYIKKSNFEQLLSYLKVSNTKLGIIACFTPSGVRVHRLLNDNPEVVKL